jgi:hypothetical protein
MTTRYAIALEKQHWGCSHLTVEYPEYLQPDVLSRSLILHLLDDAQPLYVDTDCVALITALAAELQPHECVNTLKSTTLPNIGFAFLDGPLVTGWFTDSDTAISALLWRTDRPVIVAFEERHDALCVIGAVNALHPDDVPNQTTVEQHLAQVLEAPTGNRWVTTGVVAVGLLAALSQFVEQRLCVRRTSVAHRSLRRRLEREGRYVPAIDVIELRTRDYQRVQNNDCVTERTLPTWSCRWVVRRHWRNQWCSGEKQHRRILVESYVKGPPTKPLKNARKLYAVVR